MTQIDISINSETTELIVRNDGDGIDIAMHPEHKVYGRTHLWSFVDFNQLSQRRKAYWRQKWLWAKLANIFSHRFEVETVDRHTQQRYLRCLKIT